MDHNRTDIKVLLMPISHHHGDSFCKWRATPEYSLVGGLNPLKNMKVSWDDFSQYM
jgi:hypothetical protein